MSTSDLKLSIGTAGFPGAEKLQPALDASKAAGIKEVDTAEGYGNNELDLGTVRAAEQGFIISTKNSGGWRPGALKEVTSRLNASLDRLQVKSVDILYIHGPDRELPLDEWVPQVDALHKEGKFSRLGVSNFSPEEVRALHDYAKAKGYVLPTVYQGNYNAVSRLIDDTLFPVLRELGIAFYAYSPVAGGFLTKTRAALEAGTADGRFAKSQDSAVAKMYQDMYYKPKFLEGLGRFGELAEKQGVSNAELAYRWVYYHSRLRQDEGDVVIVGASRPEQITKTVEGIRRGPLKPEVVEGIEELWQLVKDDAFVDNFEQSKGQPAAIPTK
jgi:aflatoxin B1 aldehyde reductase